MSFGVSFSCGQHESVHVLINSFLGITKFFLELVMELIFVVSLLIQLFNSSNQNKVSFFLSIEQVHEVSLFNSVYVGSVSDFSCVGLCFLFGQFFFESFNSFFHHLSLFLCSTVLLIASASTSAFASASALGLFLFFFFDGDLIGGVLLCNDDTSIVSMHVVRANFEVISFVSVNNRDFEVKGKEAISDRQFQFFFFLIVELSNVEMGFSEDSIRFSLGGSVNLNNKLFVLNLLLVDEELRDK